MPIITLSLPEDLNGFINFLVQTGEYNTASEYICELLREERRKKREQKLATLLQEGLESGEPIIADEAYWEARRRELLDE